MRLLASVGLALLFAPAPLLAQFDNQTVTATLTGYQAVPAVSSDGRGLFTGTLLRGGSGPLFRYALDFGDLAEDIAPTAIHIHFAQEGVNGGIAMYLCQAGTPAPCPTSHIGGYLSPANLVTINSQNIAFDDFDKFLRALFAGKLYVDIHTARVPSGEIRGQIKADAFQ